MSIQRMIEQLQQGAVPQTTIDEIVTKMNRLDKLTEAAGWVVRDAMYKAPEQFSHEVVQLYVGKLGEALRP